MKKVLLSIGIIFVLVFGYFLVVTATMTEQEKMDLIQWSATNDLEGTEIKLSGGGRNGTPTLYLRENGKGFFQYMRGSVPNCRADLMWSYDVFKKELTISGISNRNCNLASFNRIYSY